MNSDQKRSKIPDPLSEFLVRSGTSGSAVTACCGEEPELIGMRIFRCPMCNLEAKIEPSYFYYEYPIDYGCVKESWVGSVGNTTSDSGPIFSSTHPQAAEFMPYSLKEEYEEKIASMKEVQDAMKKVLDTKRDDSSYE